MELLCEELHIAGRETCFSTSKALSLFSNSRGRDSLEGLFLEQLAVICILMRTQSHQDVFPTFLAIEILDT